MTLQTFLFIRFIRSLAKQVLSLCLRWFLEDARPPLSTHNRGLKTSFMSPQTIWIVLCGAGSRSRSRDHGNVCRSFYCLPPSRRLVAPLCAVCGKRGETFGVLDRSLNPCRISSTGAFFHRHGECRTMKRNSTDSLYNIDLSLSLSLWILFRSLFDLFLDATLVCVSPSIGTDRRRNPIWALALFLPRDEGEYRFRLESAES